MKMKLFPILLLIVSLALISCDDSSNPTTESVDPPTQVLNKFVKVQYTSFKDFCFFDANNGVAVRDGGLYYTTQDGAKNWNEFTAPQSVYLNSVFGLNNNFWLASTKFLDTNFIYKYNQGNLSKVTIPEIESGDFVSSMYFYDTNSGFIATASNTTTPIYHFIFKTGNGGATWDTLSTFFYSVRNINMYGDSLGFCTSYATAILKTTDGWNSYRNVMPSGLASGFNYPSISHIEKIDNTHYIAVGGAGFGDDKGFICVSSDAGETWSYSNISHTLKDVAVVSGKVFVCGNASYVARCTVDLNNFTAQYFVDNLVAYTCSYDDKSDFISDTGVPIGQSIEFSKIIFPDDKHGFLHGDAYLFAITLE